MKNAVIFVPFSKVVRDVWDDDRLIHRTDVKGFDVLTDKRVSFIRHECITDMNNGKNVSDTVKKVF